MNNYTSYYLRFTSQEQADQKLIEVNYLRTYEDNEEIRTYYTTGDIPGDIDIVGEIWNDDAIYEIGEETEEIIEISSPTKKDGWHINIILSSNLPEELQEFIVEPSTPSRRFAGYQ